MTTGQIVLLAITGGSIVVATLAIALIRAFTAPITWDQRVDNARGAIVAARKRSKEYELMHSVDCEIRAYKFIEGLKRSGEYEPDAIWDIDLYLEEHREAFYDALAHLAALEELDGVNNK